MTGGLTNSAFTAAEVATDIGAAAGTVDDGAHGEEAGEDEVVVVVMGVAEEVFKVNLHGLEKVVVMAHTEVGASD